MVFLPLWLIRRSSAARSLYRRQRSAVVPQNLCVTALSRLSFAFVWMARTRNEYCLLARRFCPSQPRRRWSTGERIAVFRAASNHRSARLSRFLNGPPPFGYLTSVWLCGTHRLVPTSPKAKTGRSSQTAPYPGFRLDGAYEEGKKIGVLGEVAQ